MEKKYIICVRRTEVMTRGEFAPDTNMIDLINIKREKMGDWSPDIQFEFDNLQEALECYDDIHRELSWQEMRHNGFTYRDIEEVYIEEYRYNEEYEEWEFYDDRKHSIAESL